MSGSYGVKFCRTCGEPVIWAVTTRGVIMPVDAFPGPKGNINLDWDGRKVIAHITPAEELHDATEYYLSHFATCKNAARHRRTK